MQAASTGALGPYNRFAVWTQGCLKRCPGCISKKSQPLDGGYETDADALAAEIINAVDIEGITISGGEPFLQAEALVYLIKQVRKKKDIGVIIYTGMKLSEIEESELAKISDLIIDGEYRKELNDGLSLGGSSNQNICLITDRYKEEAKNLYGVPGRKVEVQVGNGKTTMVGIPDENSEKFFNGGGDQ